MGFRRHAHTGIGDRQHHIEPGLDGGSGLHGVGIDHHVARFDHQLAAARHGVGRVYRQVQQYLLYLARVRLDASERFAGAEGELDVFVDQPLQQFVHIGDQRIHVEDGGFKRLAPAERQHLARQRRRTVGGLADLLPAAMQGILFRQAVDNQLGVALDDREKVIEVVGDTAGQAPESFHLLRLAKLLLQLAFLRFVFLKRAAHLIERSRHVRDFVAALRLQRERVIAALQRLHTAHEIAERARKRVRNEKRQIRPDAERQHAHSSEQVVQFGKEGFRTRVGFQRDHPRRRAVAVGKSHGNGIKAFIPDFNLPGGLKIPRLLIQVVFIEWAHRAGDHAAVVQECQIGGTGAVEIVDRGVVDFASDHDRAELGVVFVRSAVDRFDRHLVERAAGVPPVLGGAFLAIELSISSWTIAGVSRGFVVCRVMIW